MTRVFMVGLVNEWQQQERQERQMSKMEKRSLAEVERELAEARAEGKMDQQLRIDAGNRLIEAEQERDEALDTLKRMTALCTRTADANAANMQERDRLREALESLKTSLMQYGGHFEGCKEIRSRTDCDCGYLNAFVAGGEG